MTKPLGSLGRLEELSIHVAAITGQERPRLTHKVVITVAGDHGVVRAGVSAYPPEVTPQMVLNFLHNGAAINVLARHARARGGCRRRWRRLRAAGAPSLRSCKIRSARPTWPRGRP